MKTLWKIHLTLLPLLLVASAIADGPKDNLPDQVRRIPKLGVEVPADKREKLEAGLKTLADKIADLQKKKDARVQALLPDVQIFYRAVHDGLRYQEFFKPQEVDQAFQLLETGKQRADQLAAGQAPWTEAKGLVVRGYVSKIDRSVQPYGLVIPPSYRPGVKQRLDVWFHGRGETLSEGNFLRQRMRSAGVFAPQDAIVLHPYGRYSNAFKFAGEVDVLEAIESVRQRYSIDDDRTSVRGFSMGGAACWQFAVHYSDRWFAANPGAGFSETPEFLKSFQQEKLDPPWYEEKLWRMYDCNLWAENLVHCPTVAYSGEIDRQKQAADIMETALGELKIPLKHLIGPKTGHRYHPDARDEAARLMQQIALQGRQRTPREVRLTTYTLKYNKMAWVTIDGMKQHWEKAHVRARINQDSWMTILTENVTDMTFEMPAGHCPLRLGNPIPIAIDQQRLMAVGPSSDRSWKISLHRAGDKWKLGKRAPAGLRKTHNLQGPIDDAFMDSFIFVRPTGKTSLTKTQKWADDELKRAIEHWRRHFRGHARVIDDVDVTEEHIASANLVLWGDPNSNAFLKKIGLPAGLTWNERQTGVGQKTFSAQDHALIAIYPNPKNPQRYIVLNSGFTYREYAYLNNARQTPKLPDWAIVDLRTPPNSQWPGKIVAADVFDEQWKVKSAP